jgi:hypothetical protein
MKASIHRPKTDLRPDAAVVEVLGLRGNTTNSRGRLDMTARYAGVTLIGLERTGTSTHFDLGTRNALRPTRYDRTIADSLDEIRGEIERVGGSFDRLAGHGPSAGGALVIALAKLGLFERIMVRDGVNLHAQTKPQNPVTGTANFLHYLTRGERHKPPHPFPPEIPHFPEDITPWGIRRQRAVEIRHYGPLLRSPYTAQGMQELAERPDLPIHHVGLGHTFTGSFDAAVEFAQGLQRIRDGVDDSLSVQDPSAHAAELRTTLKPDLWHSDLMDPNIAADHIGTLLSLRSMRAPA